MRLSSIITLMYETLWWYYCNLSACVCDWFLGTHEFSAFNFILKIGCDNLVTPTRVSGLNTFYTKQTSLWWYTVTLLQACLKRSKFTMTQLRPSSTALAYSIGWSGHAAPTARCFRYPTRVSGTLVLVELKGMAPPMPGWSRPQASSVGLQLMAFPVDLSMAYLVQVLSHLHIG